MRAMIAVALLTVVWVAGCSSNGLKIETASEGIYVAPGGFDDNPGTKVLPFATMQRARNEVREIKKTGLQADVNVYFRAGTYRLHDTVVFGMEDGSAAHRITYQAYPGERPVFSSGLRLTDWKKSVDFPAELPGPARGKVWEMDLPAELGRFKVMYDGEQLLPRARSEGFNSTKKEEFDSYSRIYQSREVMSSVYFPKDRIRNWINLEDVELLVYPSVGWTMNILALDWVDEGRGIARTTIPASYPMRYIKGKGDQVIPAAMFMENHIEFLDEPGEWVVDTQAEKIWYWPESGKPGDRIVVPLLKELIRVEGNIDVDGPVDVPVRNIHFRGLTFMHGARDTWQEGDRGLQHDWEMMDKGTALLRFRGAEQCSVEECRFASSGGTGLRLDLHSQEISVTRSLFEDLGVSGVLLCGYGPGTKDVNKDNVISNNRFARTGQIYWHGQALLGFQTGGNLISHNSFSDLPRKAIGMAGVRTKYFNPEGLKLRQCGSTIRADEIDWESLEGQDLVEMYDLVEPYYHTRNNIVEFNYIENVLRTGSDGAAINFTACGRGNMVRNNFVGNLPNPQTKGIRLDGHVQGMKIYNNILFNGLGLAPKPPENETWNNIIVYAGTKSDALGSGLSIMFESTVDGRIENNVIYYTDDFSIPVDRPKKPGKAIIDFDRNLYYCANRPDEAKKMFDEFRQLGFEQHGVFADPLFVDIDNLDFRLQENSPLKDMDFQEITLEGIGPTADYPNGLNKENRR